MDTDDASAVVWIKSESRLDVARHLA